jgi:hypothetical protein
MDVSVAAANEELVATLEHAMADWVAVIVQVGGVDR